MPLELGVKIRSSSQLFTEYRASHPHTLPRSLVCCQWTSFVFETLKDTHSCYVCELCVCVGLENPNPTGLDVCKNVKFALSIPWSAIEMCFYFAIETKLTARPRGWYLWDFYCDACRMIIAFFGRERLWRVARVDVTARTIITPQIPPFKALPLI